MVLNTYNSSPEYPDRYNRSRKWVKVLPIAGRPLQTAEFTEIQSILLDNLKQGFDTLFKNGSAIKGLRMNIVQRESNEVIISTTEGQVYVQGIILDVDSVSFTVPDTGTFNVGVVVTESIVTEQEDSSLRDPIKGGAILGPPGAARLVWNTTVAVLELDDITTGEFFALGKVVDGIVVQRELNPFYQVEDLLSTYIFERSGNFCVNGLEITSLGLSTRATTDQTKFEQLEAEVTEATNAQQAALASATSAQTTFNTLSTNLTDAIFQSRVSPTIANQNTVSNLQQQKNIAEQNFNIASQRVVETQQALQDKQTALTRAENLLVDREIISIAPGVAYVQGHRVNKSSPSIIYVPRNLPTTTVESATFTYQGTVSQTLRVLSGTNPNVINQLNSIEITLTGIPNNPNFNPYSALSGTTFSFYVRYLIPDDVTLEIAVTNLVDELSNIVTSNDTDFIFQLLDEALVEVTLDNAGITITSNAKKALLKNFIEISKQNISNLFFKATSINDAFNSTIVSITSKIYNDLGVEISPLGPISVDIESALMGASTSTNSYQLGLRPVARINRVVATIESPEILIVRGSAAGTTDELGDDTIVSILSVRQGTTNFVEDIDYQLVNQSQISWSLNEPASTEPAVGTDYFVKYLYTDPLSATQDFVLNESTDTIEFVGRTPAPGQSFTVDYSYYLSKAGTIAIDKDGRFTYNLSEAAREPIVPPIPDNLLGIASFKLYADRLEITQLDCRRLTVENLYDLNQRVIQNTKNTETILLDLKSIQGAEIAGDVPIGVFSEPGLDISKIDTNNSTFSLVPATRGATLAYFHRDVQLRAASGGVIHENELLKEEYITLPYTETTLISQSRRTKTNFLTIRPSTLKYRSVMYLDHYISFSNENLSTFSGCDIVSRIGTQLTTQQSSSDAVNEIIQTVRNNLGSTGYRIMESFDTGKPVVISETNTNEIMPSVFNQVTVEPFTLNVRVENLPPNQDGFIFLFNGQKVDLDTVNYGANAILVDSTPVSGSIAGAARSKTDGTISFNYPLPSNLKTGTHSLELLSNNVGYAKNFIVVYNNLLSHITLSGLKSWNAIPISTSSTVFLPRQPIDVVSEDLLRLGVDATVFPEVVDNLLPIQQGASQEFPVRYESLLQTFKSPDVFFLTSVDLRLGEGPIEADSELIVNLKGTSPDIPTKDTILSATTDIYNFITDGSVATTFNFTFPVPVQRDRRYTLGLEQRIPNASDTTVPFAVFSGVVNEPDVSTGNIIGNQLYSDGELYNSEDGVGLNLLDRADLTFELKRAEFSTTPTIVEFGTYGSADIFDLTSYFCLNTRDIIPSGTDIVYEYRSCPGGQTPCSNWIKFKPNTLICAEGAPFNLIEIRATLSSGFSNLSPMLHYTGAHVSLFSNTLNSHVQSIQTTYPSAYKNIRITIQFIKPANTNIEVQYSPNDGFAWQGPEWLTLTEDTTTQKLLDAQLGLYEVTWTRTEPTEFYILSEQRVKFRYRINLTSTNKAFAPLVKNIQTYVF